MEDRELVSITQGALAIMNPTTPAKVLAAGKAAGLGRGTRVVETGCGNGTILALWGQEYGISGLGIESREDACNRAEETFRAAGLGDRLSVRCMDARDYAPDEPFDCAVSIGASHIQGGFSATLDSLLGLVHDEGTIVIGDRCWRSDRVPPEFAREWPDVLTGYEILGTAREAGLDVAAVIRAGPEDWDRYESAIWQAVLSWLGSHSDHPDRDFMVGYLRRVQDEYFGYGREYMDWAMYVMVPGFW
ncbi:methyltransferase domain-containing protein [Methanoculleus sp. Wushi-C6]|uniref:Methyltransferase domain-containing protein n=1 Tax=Methanoculleus caldifontis TaxID=2651577 RepID=A0ABU3WZ95_9EURY|nr:methyltransferase domain-containing protein [Methanoculleus sp. Wushi-C6]MDV2481106.1 methyltransferase domain-containing protein [Methanoculleus sp. Wushi-C6]